MAKAFQGRIYMNIRCQFLTPWLQGNKVRGVCIGRTIYFRDEPSFVDRRLFKHELIHQQQMQKDGLFLFYLKYFYYSLRFGYHDNPYELEAYERQAEPLTSDEEALKWNYADAWKESKKK